HELELSVMNFSPGTPVGTATVGGDPFGYTGAFEYINAVRFTTGAGGPALDIEEIFINQIKHHVDGAEVPPDPCIVDISVAGAGITDVSVRVPNTDVHTLVYDPLADRWRHDESFASVAAMLAAYGTGDYLFTLNGGADTVTLNFAAAEPGGFAVITYPDHSQNDVEQHPTFTWNSMAGQGSFLNMWVTMDPGGLGFGLYGNWGADIEEVSWRPGPLPTDQNYEFGLAVFNGGAQAATTNGGDPFTYSGTLEYINSIEFHASPPAPMPDIEEILVGAFRDYVDGVEELIPYESEIEVFGSNITGVSVEVPNGGVHTLINDGGGEWWGLEEEFASLAALRAAFGTGDYIFTFNGGADTVTVPYSATAPTGFANITGPEHGNHGVELNPTFTWGSAVGSGDFLGMFVIEDPDGTDDDIYEAVPVDIGTISWQPGPLSDQTEYEFELAVVNGSLDGATTDQGDAFARTTVFAYINVISFDTLHWRVAGDANDDCVVNILDMILVRNKLNDDPGSGDSWWVDVTEDGFINILDMIYIRNRLNDTCNGD
ncbi:MAG: hypothetical protein HQ592_16130, partial [Planctomycetes bacterium]|nr:hypothetical protein [Planctomycetota bacterium]